MDILLETWRPVVGYEGIYEVSDLGNVRRILGGRGTRLGSNLKQNPHRLGYFQVKLYQNGESKVRYVHSLVADAFIGPTPQGLEVNHRDTDKANNVASNLEFMTHKQNVEHAFANVDIRRPCGIDHHNTKISDEDVMVIRRLRVEGMAYFRIAELFPVSKSQIFRIVKGQSWQHV